MIAVRQAVEHADRDMVVVPPVYHLTNLVRLWGLVCTFSLCNAQDFSQGTLFRGLFCMQDFRARNMHAMTPMLWEVCSSLPIACALHPVYTCVDKTFECSQPIELFD